MRQPIGKEVKYSQTKLQRCRLHMLTLEESRNTKCSFKNLKLVSGFIRLYIMNDGSLTFSASKLWV